MSFDLMEESVEWQVEPLVLEGSKVEDLFHILAKAMDKEDDMLVEVHSTHIRPSVAEMTLDRHMTSWS